MSIRNFILFLFVIVSPNFDAQATPSQLHPGEPEVCPIVGSEFTHSVSSPDTNIVTNSLLGTYIAPTLISLIPQILTAVFFARLPGIEDVHLGINIYRGVRCAELGVRGVLAFLGTYSSDLDEETSKEARRDLNKAMFGFLASDSLVQLAVGGMRPDLAVHHAMGMLAWGYGLRSHTLDEALNTNVAVELLSALKGFEHALARKHITPRVGYTPNQWMELCYWYRMGVIFLVRYPVWFRNFATIADFQNELEGFWTYFYGTLNTGIVVLETYWLYGTIRKIQRLRG